MDLPPLIDVSRNAELLQAVNETILYRRAVDLIPFEIDRTTRVVTFSDVQGFLDQYKGAIKPFLSLGKTAEPSIAIRMTGMELRFYSDCTMNIVGTNRYPRFTEMFGIIQEEFIHYLNRIDSRDLIDKTRDGMRGLIEALKKLRC